MNVETLRDSQGEWSILRINGEQIAQGHSINYTDILTYLEKNGIISWTSWDIEGQEIERNGLEHDYELSPLWVRSAYDSIDRAEDGY